jgi:pyruvate,water dikinase
LKFSQNGHEDISSDDWNNMSAEDKETDEEIKGQVACKGLATGRAKIIMHKTDFDKMEVGDVIVASMTRPEYAPILSKCAAIVTNEGGITCHAAIVSRELKVPCIIGTKNATNIIKDGDMVEVDANNGIVKIIK